MRSSEALLDDIGRAFAGGRLAILTGNVGDYHTGPEGAIVALEQFMALAAAASGCDAVLYTPATGTRPISPPGRPAVRFNGPGPAADLTTSLPRLLRELGGAERPTMLALDWAAAALGRPDEPAGLATELLCTAANDPALIRAGHRLAIVDRDGSAARSLASLPGVCIIQVPLPNMEERVAFLNHLENVHRSPQLAQIADGETVEIVARAANGMSLRTLHALMGELRHAGRSLAADALAPAKHDCLLRHTDGALRVLDESRTIDDVAGIHNIKLLVDQHRAAPHAPMRHLVLVGPPGTGKTITASALGAALGRTAVGLGLVHDRWVGSSEQRLERAIQTAESMAPTLVFVDELDQMLSGDDGPSGDGGVNKRTNARIWVWTGSLGPTTDVLIVGASNRPELLGSRIHDRFTVVPVLHPDPTEAVDIVRISAARLGRTVDHDAVIELLEVATAPMSGRTLTELVHHAARFADVASGRRVEAVDGSAMRRAMADLMPGTAAVQEELMALQAIRHTRRRSMLPWVAAGLQGAGYTIPGYLADIVDSDGEVDEAALDQRIAVLTALR